MKKIRRFFQFSIVFFLLIFIIVNTITAYDLTIHCPSELEVGQPLTVTGTSTYPSDLTVILYAVTTTSASYIKEQSVMFESGQSPRSFSSTLSTDDLKSGKYKVDVISTEDKDGNKLSSGSINQKSIILTGGSIQKTVMPTIVTTVPTTVRTPSIPTRVPTTLPPSPVSSPLSTTTIPTVEPISVPTTMIPTPAPTPDETHLNRYNTPGSTAIASIFIALIGFGIIEYSVVFWRNKKRKK